MLGSGVWVAQNKVLPGAYINIVNASAVTSTVGERGVVAFPYALGKAPGEVISITAGEFVSNSNSMLGIAYDSNKAKPLREIFKNATTCLIYDLGESGTAAQAISALESYEFNVLAAYTSVTADISAYITAVKNWRNSLGKKCQVVVYNATTPDDEAVINVISTVSDYSSKTFTGNGSTTTFTLTDKPSSVDSVLVDGVVKTATTHYSYSSATGVVTFTTPPSDATEVEVRYNTSPAHSLVAWVAGAEAGCDISRSCTNKLYDGEHTVVLGRTQAQLETCLQNGQIVFHQVYGDVRMLEDINSLTTTTAQKGEDFKSNQTIRVIDQIANDIARLFNTTYLGQIPNNASGRASLWADIVSHHQELEEIQAIENFNPELVTVEQGQTRKSVVVNDAVQVTNAMSILYMTLVIN